jgi:hypothetical protein
LPGLPNDLPERPDLSLPGLGSPADSGAGLGSGLNLEGLGSGKPDEPTLEFPKSSETKPGEAAPVENPAEPAKPAEAAKPAEGTPPETKPQ